MKKNAVALPFAVGAFLLLAACGDDVTKMTVNETGISQLAKGAEFPECSTETNGEMLYAADSGKAYICTGKAWTPLHGESSADTVVVRDTLLQKDSVFFSQVDTLVIRDTLLGLNGESCTAETLEDSRGYKIVCGGDSVGVVLNGVDGEKGDDGESCTVADSGNGVVTVQCESDTVKLYKALCANEPFDPSESFCYNDGAKDTIVTLCDGNAYDLGESFCGKTLASNDTVLFYDTLSTTYLNQTKLASGDYGYLLDTRDGQVYRTTTIGTQTWMAQNLNYGYNEGTAKSYCYSDDTSNCTKYGRLYTWSAAMDSVAVFSTDGSGCGNGKTCSATEPVRGVCPEGWHLPTLAEFETLITYVGGESPAGKMLKATSGWDGGGNGTDDYGFSALPAGFSNSVDFLSAGYDTDFWSVTEYGADWARYMDLNSDNDDAFLVSFKKYGAFSVRCLKDSD